ncbi:Fc.00g047820.m01.CDS01 [Cosmosporella sp. VM-42]
MATPELAIAKATLSATLFRADPTSLSRPAVDAFFPLLSSALCQCSRPNVQKCKAWLVDHVAPSGARTAALAKFLVALSKSFGPSDGEKPSVKRRRLHVLYVVNDVLHHVVRRNGDGRFATAWESALPGLIASAAAFENCPKHEKKLEDLIILWEEKQYFRPDVISKLREALTNGSTSTPTIESHPTSTSLKVAKDTPYVLPSFHGDSSIPWHDLPAATWLPHFTPNSTKPMVPDLIRPIQFAPGPADKVLADAVRNLLSDVDRLFAKERKWDDDPQVGLNELGERVELDEVTGEIIDGETYYGWSRRFCEKMKERKKKAKNPGRGRSRSPSSSLTPRGGSQSSSPPAFKRRKLSTSRSPSRSPSPSRNRRRSRSHSRSRSRSRSPEKRYARRRSYSRSPSRSPPRHHRSRSPLPPSTRPHRPGHDHRPPHQPPYPPHANFQPIPPPNEFPVPPPPPAGYQGPWPPPPPPMSGPTGWFPNQNMMPHQMMGGWPPHAPPPPQPPHGYGPPPNNFGRGNGGFRGRGRGGYDRGGRGGW